jgi:hypothetical protein
VWVERAHYSFASWVEGFLHTIDFFSTMQHAETRAESVDAQWLQSCSGRCECVLHGQKLHGSLVKLVVEHSLHCVSTTGIFPWTSTRHMSSMGNVTSVPFASNSRLTKAQANPSLASGGLDASDALMSVALVSVGVASGGGSVPA